jgi:hypothetical protein
MNQLRRYAVVLSVYLNTRGFAFVLFEGPVSPFDWGVKEVRGRGKRRRCLINIEALFGRYQPDILVLQDMSPSGTTRAPRINHLNAAIATLAEGCGMPVYSYSREVVRAGEQAEHRRSHRETSSGIRAVRPAPAQAVDE